LGFSGLAWGWKPRPTLGPGHLENSFAARQPAKCGQIGESLAHVGHQPHEARTLDRRAGGSLKGRATAAPFAGKHLVLIGAELFEQTDVFVIDIGGPRAAIPSAKPTAILAVASKLLTRHKPEFL
jgi:hypothetical protein